ncbi:hypothetical protein NQ318_010817 [Aromia moschata]|uniref:Zinc carboxypeptidase A 1 n=1 Tax=Aromia moschata TaxID=1265417 RepID=A0AAV8YJ28_9CUCU|nr:hypothetical protein NQ318_010817 [Aromia moschata]
MYILTDSKTVLLLIFYSYKVYQVTPRSMEEADIVKQFENDDNFDFWSDLRAINASIDIMVTPAAQDEFETLLETYNIDNMILINNVEEVFEEEDNKQRISTRLASGEVSFTEFMRYDDELLAQAYPDIVTKEVLGRSFEGRDTALIRISSGGSNKTTIFVEATIHAREWIAPPVALYVIKQLVENPDYSYMYQDIDWVVIPVANPDGYEFSHTDTRLWRKTRTPGTVCYGTDANRNFDWNWRVIGASSWQCDSTYAGHVAFSEPETQNIRDYVLKYKDDIKLYVAIHSYGQWLLQPFKVYRVTPKSMNDVELLKQLEENVNYDFWSDVRALNRPVDIMVPPALQNEFENLVETHQIQSELFINDVEEVIQEESRRQRVSPRLTRGEVTFSEYMRYDDIVAYLVRLGQEYSNIITTEVVGRSFEGRDIYLVKISSGGSNKTTIFAEGTIHAREWIVPPVMLYIINQLVENGDNSYLYEDIDWAIIPVVNPDGYEFSHEDTRLWRKTRTPGTICYGTDGNRNFDYKWMVSGASNWQCHETYAGHIPFSEPETRAIQDYVLQHKDDIKLYLSVHSYGRWMLHPWGYTTEDADNVAELKELGDLFAAAIYDVNGTVYRVGSSAGLLGFAAGGSDDWGKGGADIDLAYTVELPDDSFILPVERIQPVVEESWEGFKALHDYIREKFVVNSTRTD